MSERIKVVSPDGTAGSIPAENRDVAISKGYKISTEASEHPVRAGISSAISAATFGFADYALSDENKAGAQRLRGENPTANTVGNVVGSIAGTALVPELGVAGTAAKVGRVAFEGGLMGLGPQISEAALSNKPINKELLAADIASGALANVAFFGGLKGAGVMASKAAGKAGEVFASTLFKDAAASIKGTNVKKFLEIDDAAYKAGERLGVFGATTPQGVAALSQEAARKGAGLIGERMDDVALRFPDTQDAVNTWKQLAAAPIKENLAKMKAIEAELVPAERELTKAGRGLGEMFEDFHHASAIAEKASAPRPGFDVVDAAFGGGALSFLSPKAAVVQVAGKYVRHLAKSKALLLNKPLDAMAGGEVLPKLAESLKSRVQEMMNTAPGALGAFGTVLSDAAAQGTDALLATHAKLAAGPQGGQYLASLGLRPETPEESRAYGQKLATLQALEDRRAKFEKTSDRNLDAFFSGKVPEFSSNTPPKHEDSLKAINETLRSSERLLNAIPSDVRTGTPALAIDAAMQAGQIAKFLSEKAPKPLDAWKPKALQAPFNPAPGEIQKFNRYVQSINDPGTLSRDLAAGRSNPQAAEVLKNFYPSIYQRTVTQVMSRVGSLKKPLSYSQKVLLSESFGPQILGVSPQQVLYLQSTHQATTQQNQPPAASGDGRQVVDSAKNMQTQTQRIESRGQQ